MPRDRLIQVKVSEEEKETIRAKAERMGVQPSQYLRAVGLQFIFGGEETPVPYETQQDKANKAKVRQAVENEESYEVKVEPGTSEPLMPSIERTAWIAKRVKELGMRMGSRAAQRQAEIEWEERNP